MQLTHLHPKIDKLQLVHGAQNLASIYGAGCIQKPNIMFVFMNPTKRNISSNLGWKGLRAPWLGTKNIWRMFYDLNLLSKANLELTQRLRPKEWTKEFCNIIYKDLALNKVYITNLAKCTQNDARPLPNQIFREYLESTRKEIALIKPRKIILFGNQVSSIILDKPIKISEYKGIKSEALKIGETTFRAFPVYYPVGQGQRNIHLAIKRIKKIIII
jgi:DNA polymerase